MTSKIETSDFRFVGPRTILSGKCKVLVSLSTVYLTVNLDSFSGECDCMDGFLPWANEPTCYREFFRGPCPQNHQLVNENDQPVCRKSDCPNELIRWKNGACVQPIDCRDRNEFQVFSISFLLEKYHLNFLKFLWSLFWK